MKTLSKYYLLLVFSLILTSLCGQDIFYTISGEINDQKVGLDSILFENLHNETRLLFDNLSEQPDYVINLSAQTFWGATGVSDLSFENGFSLLTNTDGNLSIACNLSSKEPIQVSIYNVQGKRLYASLPLQITKGNSIHINLAKYGVYFVKIESSRGSTTYKAIGSYNVNAFDVALNYQKPLINTRLKSSLNNYDSDFSFEIGDSLRVSIYKDGFYTMPNIQPILASIPVNFVFNASTVNETGITDTYVDIPEEMQDSLNFNVSTGEIIVTGDINLTTGNVIVIDADTSGFLRKIVNVRDDDGTIVLETVQAYLNEIFVEADFKLNTEFIEPSTTLKSTSSTQEIIEALTDEKGYIHPVKVIYFDKTGILNTKSALEYKSNSDESIDLMDYYNDLSDTDLYGNEGDNKRLYIDEGHVSFAADAVFEFDFIDGGRIDEVTKIKIGDINSFKFYIDAQAGFKTLLALDLNDDYSKDDTKKLFDFPKAIVKFLVPPAVPIWITFDCDVYGRYDFNADASLHADWGFESNHSLQAGGLFERSSNAFSPINEYVSQDTIFPLKLEEVEVNASARFEIYPRVDIKLYGVIGPYAEVVPFVDAGYNAAYQSQTTSAGTESFLAWNSNIDLGLDFRLGVDLRFLGYNKDFGPTVINAFNTPLWRSPEALELLTDLPNEADAGSVVSLTFKVTDLLNLPVPLCYVYIEGDGSFNKQLEKTDINGEVTIDWTLGNAGENNVTAFIYNAEKTILNQLQSSVTAISTGDDGTTGTFTDPRDGQTYTTIEIGNQVWMAENLNYETSDSWWYDNSFANGDIYGRLYTWDAALNACPSGWNLPSDEDWKIMEMALGMSQTEADDTVNRGTDEGMKMKSTSGWYKDGNGTNSSGFNALPGGGGSGLFYYLGSYCYLWSSSEYSSTFAWGRGLSYESVQVYRYASDKPAGFSVRCLKD